jgi:hypothetical protein
VREDDTVLGVRRAVKADTPRQVETLVLGSAPGLLVGFCLGLLALGPGIRRGFLLSYDMVFVPRESFRAALDLGGPPRAVPSDIVMAVAEQVLPADIVQKIALLAIFTLACGGVAVLLREQSRLARLAAGVFYTWNPYVAERLIIGQWALLLGYAGLPWVLAAARRPAISWWRLALAMLPAIIGGFAAMAITALVVVPVAVSRRSGRDAIVILVVFVGGCLPWLIPSLLHHVYADPRAVAAFSARADTPFGSVGSLLMLSGIWNAQTVPVAYGGALSGLWLAVAGVACAGYILLARPSRRWTGLGTGAIAGLVVASIGVTAPGRDLLRAAISAWPGIAVLRDGQQFVAPLALAEALGFGVVVSWVMLPHPFRKKKSVRTQRTPDPAGLVYGGVALLAPLLLLPGLAWGAAGRLRPAWYPPGWATVARVVDGASARGEVLLLPWVADRRPGWNHYGAVLDPWPRLLSRYVIWNDGTRVGNVAMSPDDPAARRLDAVVSATGPMTAALRAAGVRFALADSGPSVAGRLPGCRVLLADEGVVVYEIPMG